MKEGMGIGLVCQVQFTHPILCMGYWCRIAQSKFVRGWTSLILVFEGKLVGKKAAKTKTPLQAAAALIPQHLISLSDVNTPVYCIKIHLLPTFVNSRRNIV